MKNLIGLIALKGDLVKAFFDTLTFEYMEVVKYLCEFFFGNFWHWLGLLFIIATICGMGIVKLGFKEDNKDERENQG